MSSRLSNLLIIPLYLLAAVLAVTPWRLMQALGKGLGNLWYYGLPIRRSVVTENLAFALPDLGDRERQEVTRGVLVHVATTVLELLWTTPRRYQALLERVEVHGLEHYERLAQTGRGVVAVTAHLGNWDLLACSQALGGTPLAIVSKNLSASFLSDYWMSMRRRTGLTILPARDSLRKIVTHLRRGDVVGLVVDQRTPASQGGRLLPFLGQPAWTTVAPHVLAARTGAALLPVWAVRLPDGRHRVTVGREINTTGRAQDTMEAINHELGHWIRQYPDQWLWLHRRWRL